MGDRVFPERGIVWKMLEWELWGARAGDNDRDRRAATGAEQVHA